VRPYSPDHLYRDLTRLWDHLGIAKSHFVNLSLGGMIGMRLNPATGNILGMKIQNEREGFLKRDAKFLE
jgi:hypothetical protein